MDERARKSMHPARGRAPTHEERASADKARADLPRGDEHEAPDEAGRRPLGARSDEPNPMDRSPSLDPHEKMLAPSLLRRNARRQETRRPKVPKSTAATTAAQAATTAQRSSHRA